MDRHELKEVLTKRIDVEKTNIETAHKLAKNGKFDEGLTFGVFASAAKAKIIISNMGTICRFIERNSEAKTREFTYKLRSMLVHSLCGKNNAEFENLAYKNLISTLTEYIDS